MKTIIFIRHGETAVNKAGVLHKHKDVESLNNNGVDQITKTAKQIIKYEPEIIYSSNENRSVDSAKLISRITTRPHKIIGGLEERNWGKLSGKPWSEINNIVSKMSLKERYLFIPPQGESWKSFEDRLIKALKKILKNMANTIVVVTHGGAIRALMPYLLKVPKEESFKYDPDNASITIFEYNEKKFKQLIYNETSHLN